MVRMWRTSRSCLSANLSARSGRHLAITAPTLSSRCSLPSSISMPARMAADPLGDRVELVVVVAIEPAGVAFEDELVVLDQQKAADVEVLLAEPTGELDELLRVDADLGGPAPPAGRCRRPRRRRTCRPRPPAGWRRGGARRAPRGWRPTPASDEGACGSVMAMFLAGRTSSRTGRAARRRCYFFSGPSLNASAVPGTPWRGR